MGYGDIFTLIGAFGIAVAAGYSIARKQKTITLFPGFLLSFSLLITFYGHYLVAKQVGTLIFAGFFYVLGYVYFVAQYFNKRLDEIEKKLKS